MEAKTNQNYLTMKNYLASMLAAFCLGLTGLFAGQPENGSLKKDIEYLFDLLENTALSVDLRHQCYGLDIAKIKSEMLPFADTVKNSAECALLIRAILTRFNDPALRVYYPEANCWLNDKKDIKDAKNRFSKDFFLENRYVRQSAISFDGIWKDGGFYISETRLTSKDPNLAKNPKRFKAGSQVILMDGRKLEPFQENFTESRSTDIRYNPQDKQVYAHGILPQNSLSAVSPKGDTVTAERPFYTSTYYESYSDFKPSAFLFDNTTLYVHVPSMMPQHLSFFRKELRKRHLTRVIVDMRDCTDGLNGFWHELLSLLVFEPLDFEEHFAVKKSELSRQFLESAHKKGSLSDGFDISESTLPDLPNVPVYLLSRHISIQPKGLSKRSLHLGIKIAVLFNENSGAAALNMLQILNRFPQTFVTVGVRNNSVGGAGMASFEYVLPHSKIAVRIPSGIATEGPASAPRLPDVTPMINVAPDIHDFLNLEKVRYENGENRYAKEVLKDRDRIFELARQAVE